MLCSDLRAMVCAELDPRVTMSAAFNPRVMMGAGLLSPPDTMSARLPTLREARIAAVRETMTAFLLDTLPTGGIPSLAECRCPPRHKLAAIREVLERTVAGTLFRVDTVLPCKHAQALAREAAGDPAQLAIRRAEALALAGELIAKGKEGEEELCTCAKVKQPCIHAYNRAIEDLRRWTAKRTRKKTDKPGPYDESKKPKEPTNTTPQSAARMRVIAERISRHESCRHPQDIECRMVNQTRGIPRHRREGK